jgi:hypothetical protein
MIPLTCEDNHIAHLLRTGLTLAGVPKKKGNFDQI